VLFHHCTKFGAKSCSTPKLWPKIEIQDCGRPPSWIFWALGPLGLLIFHLGTVQNLVQKCWSTTKLWPKIQIEMVVRHLGFTKTRFLSNGSPWAGDYPPGDKIFPKSMGKRRQQKVSFLVCFSFLIPSARAQVAPVDRSPPKLACKCGFGQGCAFWGSRWWLIMFRGSYPSKTKILGAWIGISSQSAKKFKSSYLQNYASD